MDLTYHCISSCATVAANVSIAGLARNIRDKSGAKKTPSENLRGNATSTKPLNKTHFTGWYDDSAAAVIQREFGADFAAFGYPTDSRRMHDEEERRPPQVFFRLQKRIQAPLANYTHILPHGHGHGHMHAEGGDSAIHSLKSKVKKQPSYFGQCISLKGEKRERETGPVWF